MWFQKFLDIINPFPSENPISGIEDALARLNPDKIYVENVRSLLDVSYRTAEQMCETAVRQGFFTKRIEVLCPDDSVAVSAEKEDDLPATVTRWQETDGDYEEIVLNTNTLRRIVFYALNDVEARSLYETPA